jgi:hypothetical protein
MASQCGREAVKGKIVCRVSDLGGLRIGCKNQACRSVEPFEEKPATEMFMLYRRSIVRLRNEAVTKRSLTTHDLGIRVSIGASILIVGMRKVPA